MTLALSTAVAQDLTPAGLAAFDAACRARGLDGLELEVDASGDMASGAIEAQARQLQSSGARVLALRSERLVRSCVPALARAAAVLAAPVSVPARAVAVHALPELAEAFADAGARLLLSHATDLDQIVALLPAIAEHSTLGLAWDVRPASEDLEGRGAVLLAAREQLGLVRLYGGGPAQREQDGRGVGPLLHGLATTRSTGPIVLPPSTLAVWPRWRRWLSSRGSAGCGAGSPLTRDGDFELDVRDVEPKDRLETILGGYRALEPGATLTLTVDHDPICMYHTLNATEPEGTFTFRKLDDGPEVWHAEVTKLSAKA